MSRADRISSEAGQLNVTLAVIHAMLEAHSASEVEIHACSFEPARRRLPGGVTFHQLPGLSQMEVTKQNDLSKGLRAESMAELSHKSGFRGVFRSLDRTPRLACPYSVSEYLKIAVCIEEIILIVKPDLMVVDSLMPTGLDAAQKHDVQPIMLSPNAWQDNVGISQGLGIVKWPYLGTAWSYPLLKRQIPLNLILYLKLVATFAVSHRYHSLMSARRRAGYRGDFPLYAGETRLCMGVPQLETPGKPPDSVIPIGPMLLPAPLLIDVDRGLDQWLNHKASDVHGGMFTIFFALGSHVRLNENRANALLMMFRQLLEERPDIRLYAKIMRQGEYDLPIIREIERDMGKHRLRIDEWMKADPIALLETGKVDLVIHHGGSNSYHEALSLGIPQIALASWTDCYDFAARIENLGIGKWGNRKAGPGFEPVELISAIRSAVASYPILKARAVERAQIAANATQQVRGHDGADLIFPEKKGVAGQAGRDVAAAWILGKARSVIQ